jgi:hypothetical protein
MDSPTPATTPVPTPTTAYEPLRSGVHALIGVTIGIVSPFTALAWPFALLVGMIIGSADARRQRDERDTGAEMVARGLLAGLGVLGMLFFGVIIGGLIAIIVVVLAVFSERVAAQASPTDRGVARILLFVIPIVMWFVFFPLLGVGVDVNIDS